MMNLIQVRVRRKEVSDGKRNEEREKNDALNSLVDDL